MDTRDDEKERGITIKSTAISMFFAMDKEELGAVSQTSNGEFPAMSLAGVRLSEERKRWEDWTLIQDEASQLEKPNSSISYSISFLQVVSIIAEKGFEFMTPIFSCSPSASFSPLLQSSLLFTSLRKRVLDQLDRFSRSRRFLFRSHCRSSCH